ncbi:hypothetical protein [Massilia sp. DD77]|uniref:hypothetical protein n=1 Tax=Massilia sp. DD77 TaxID=3109349 RepID=UPI002FFE2B2E
MSQDQNSKASASGKLTLTGRVVEVGNLDGGNVPGFVIDRGGLSYATVTGLTEAEARAVAWNYDKPITIKIGQPVAAAPGTQAATDDIRIARHALFNLKEFRAGRTTFPGEALAIMEGCLDRLAALQQRPAPAQATEIATITLDGRQLRHALDIINPDGLADMDQLDDWLTFGVVQHRDDDGMVESGMCCWNDDTDGVIPLDDEYAPALAQQAEAAPVARPDNFGEEVTRLVNRIREPLSMAMRDSLVEELIELIDPTTEGTKLAAPMASAEPGRLTDERLSELFEREIGLPMGSCDILPVRAFARAIEAEVLASSKPVDEAAGAAQHQ